MKCSECGYFSDIRDETECPICKGLEPLKKIRKEQSEELTDDH